MKNEMLALILAGGQGTRLGKLTQNIANLVDAIALSILLYQIVPIQVFIMSELLHNTNRSH